MLSGGVGGRSPLRAGALGHRPGRRGELSVVLLGGTGVATLVLRASLLADPGVQSETSAVLSIRSVKAMWENSGGLCAGLRYNGDYGDGFLVETRLLSSCLDRMWPSTHERNCTERVPSQVNRSACQLRVGSSTSSTTCSTLQRLSPLRSFFLTASLTHSPSSSVAFSSVNGARK